MTITKDSASPALTKSLFLLWGACPVAIRHRSPRRPRTTCLVARRSHLRRLYLRWGVGMMRAALAGVAAVAPAWVLVLLWPY